MKITVHIRAYGARVYINVSSDGATFTISDRSASYALTNAAVDVYDAFRMFLSLNPKLDVVFDINHQQLQAAFHERAAQSLVTDITNAIKRAGA